MSETYSVNFGNGRQRDVLLGRDFVQLSERFTRPAQHQNIAAVVNVLEAFTQVGAFDRQIGASFDRASPWVKLK